MDRWGFFRVAACTPKLMVANCQYNASEIRSVLLDLEQLQVDLAVFPELSITGYTCSELFHQHQLAESAVRALSSILEHTSTSFSGTVILGMPLIVGAAIYNVAVVLQRDRLLGIVPKSYLPNYKEFYEARYFSPAVNNTDQSILICNQTVPFGTNLIFVNDLDMSCRFGVEICEDLWVPNPPSGSLAINGATVIANLSASNELIGKSQYRRQLISSQSGRCIAGYIYAASGPTESSTDLVFGGHSLIAENGVILAESDRFNFSSHFICRDLDLKRLLHDRISTTTFSSIVSMNSSNPYRVVPFQTPHRHARKLLRHVEASPFVPSDSSTLDQRSEEILQIQTTALARRLASIGTPRLSIGVSGGLDSTLALIVAIKSLDLLQQPRSRLLGLTMPGYGTTQRTRRNADTLMAELGISSATIDIREMCLKQFQAIGHRPFGINVETLDVETFSKLLSELPDSNRSDLVFENVQARMRTSLLMNSGFVIGTGDLSELALGWCTYNADHMSMYNPNVSIPKTLVKFLIRWAAQHLFDGKIRSCLYDILDTAISPELLPTNAAGQPTQSTEGTVGPYELHDFYLYHFLRFGTPPSKILYLATYAKFSREYSLVELRKWLRVFLTRFFQSQYKRSCLPDGPKVGSVSLSPRGDWRMPSDASVDDWLVELETFEDPK